MGEPRCHVGGIERRLDNVFQVAEEQSFEAWPGDDFLDVFVTG